MSANCKGKRRSKTHFGSPKLAFSFTYIFKLAGKMAISKSMIPHADILVNAGINNPIPKMISANPLNLLIRLGFEK